MDPQAAGFWLIAWPVIMGLGAAGAVLWIKIQRRRAGTVNPGMSSAVPVKPLSDADARRMIRRYLWVAGLIMTALIIVGFLLGGVTW